MSIRSSPTAVSSDEDLMEAFVAGSAHAFEILVHRHGRALFAFLLRSVGHRARAEELLQEVFMRVIRAKTRYRRSAKLSTWMFTIARNLCVDESRRARFRDHVSLDRPARATCVAPLSAADVSVEDAADAPFLRSRLRAAVSRLPDDQREVFLLRQLGGLSFRDIGDAVGAPENTVKSRMRYALEKLREELYDVYDGLGLCASPSLPSQMRIDSPFCPQGALSGQERTNRQRSSPDRSQ